MTKPLKPATPKQLFDAQDMLDLLCSARNKAFTAGATKTLERIRLSISSARGAIRHLEHRVNRSKT